MPLIIAMMLTALQEEQVLEEGLEVWPFALFAGLVFVIPYVILANTLGQNSFHDQRPVRCGHYSYAASKGFLQPAKPWDFDEQSEWEPF